MKSVLFGVAAAAVLTSVALADGLSDANAGMDALSAGDNAKAVAMFTRAITQGKLNNDDKELAYVKRAQAYIGEDKNSLALADLAKAKALKPDDTDIDALQAQASGKPAGPTLADTLSFLEQNLAYSINYILQYDNTKNNSTFTNQYSETETNVRGNPGNCTIGGHYVDTHDGKTTSDADFAIHLSKIRSVEEISIAQIQAIADAAAGHPEYVVTGSNPSVFVIRLLHTDDNKDEVYYFTDDDQAQQVGKALQHASELCGAKRPF